MKITPLFIPRYVFMMWLDLMLQ